MLEKSKKEGNDLAIPLRKCRQPPNLSSPPVPLGNQDFGRNFEEFSPGDVNSRVRTSTIIIENLLFPSTKECNSFFSINRQFKI